VIVGTQASSSTEITWLSRRGQSTGRLSVDVDVDPPVDGASSDLAGVLGGTAALQRYAVAIDVRCARRGLGQSRISCA